MEFIENNYVLVIVIGVIVLMTIIGYFADKMETKEKQPKVKKEKKKEKKNQIMEQVPEMEVQNVDGDLPSEWDENYVPTDEEQEVMNIEGTGDTDEWNVLPTEPVVNYEESTDFNPEQEVSFEGQNDTIAGTEIAEENIAVEDGMFDFNTDGMFGNESVNSEIPEVENAEPINNEVPEQVEFSETLENVESENVNEVSEQPEFSFVDESEQDTIQEVIPEQIDELNNLEITLPDVQMLNDEGNNTTDDEDVWKF